MQFVVSNRRAGKFTEIEKRVSRDAVNLAANLALGNVITRNDVSPDDPLARRTLVMEGSETEMRAYNDQTPDDVIVEPVIRHQTMNTILGVFGAAKVNAANSSFPTGTEIDQTVNVRGDSRPLEGATVYLILRDFFGRTFPIQTTTDINGDASFAHDQFLEPVLFIADPWGDFWSNRMAVSPTRHTVIRCRRIARSKRIDWWHRQTGLDTFDQKAGEGIKIGVLDTGFGPHIHLNGEDVGAFIEGEFSPKDGADIGQHGSHVCGTIAGNPGTLLRRTGIAPGASLYSARVFPHDKGASNADIANAIEFLSRTKECDLLNLSLGAPIGSEIVQDAMQDALERGTLCVCAAANDFTHVYFPAAFPQAIAVSACGKIDGSPPESISARKEPLDPTLFGRDQLFFANFSCFGPEVDSIAPGVGIIAPVPAAHGLQIPYKAMDGTSMATPVACGTLARALSKNAAYRAMDRNIHKAEMARAVLHQLCNSIGLDRDFEGRGVPKD